MSGGTWADVVAEGGGPYNLRLVLEGAECQFVEAIEQRGYCYDASLLPAAGSETWTAVGGTPVITTGIADPFGGTNATTLEDNNAAGYESARPDVITYTSGTAVCGEIWVKSASGFFLQLQLAYDGVTDTAALLFDPNDGAISVLFGAFLRYEATEAVSGWWRVRFEHAGDVATTIQFRVHPAVGTTYPTRTNTAVGAATVYGPEIRMRDGRKRVVGLDRAGLGFTESAYLAGAETSVSVNPATIVETPEPDLNAATEVFSKIPSVAAWLDASLTTAATSATLLDAGDVTVGEVYHVGTEAIRVSALAGVTATLDRAVWGTTAQAHNVTNADTAETQDAPLLDGIGIWTKRRWWLYAHGPAELDVTDEGTLVMRGVIGGEPEERGGEWTIALDSRFALLDQEVAAAADVERKIRGIYYAGSAPLWLLIRRSADANLGGALAAEAEVFLSGFWETQEEFCFDLQEALNNHATISTWATWRVVARSGIWDLFYTTPSADPRFLEVFGGSPVDGEYNFPQVTPSTGDAIGARGDAGPGTNRSVVASTMYLVPWSTTSAVVAAEDARTVPRMCTTQWGGRSDTDAQVAANPIGRIYVDNAIGLAVGSTLLIPQPATEDGDEVPALELEVQSVSTAAGRVDAYGETLDVHSGITAAGAGADAISISSARSYSGASGIDLADFITALRTAAPDGANDASTPWIIADDIAEATWASVIAEASAGLPYLARRAYTFSKGQRLEEIIRQECRLYGVYPHLDADFKIALRRLTVETDEVASGLHVTGNDHIVDERRAEIRQGVDGHINVVEVARGYDQVDDKYKENPIHVRSVSGVARAKSRRVLEIRPKTSPVDDEITALQAADLANPILALFGAPKLVHVTVDVPLSFWDVLIGDSILLTDETAPHDGARGLHDPGQGLASTRAIVVGREWHLDDAAGTLTCLITGLDVAGYTPTARVASATGATTTWTLTVEASRYAPTGANDDDYFEVGHRVRLLQWDADAPTTVLGIVTAVDTTTHEIEVELDASWAGIGGGEVYNLCFADYDDATGITAAQAAYAYVASSVRRLDDGSATRAARVFAP